MNSALRLMFVLLSVASVAYSQSFTDGVWSYTIDYSNPAAGKANITGYSGPGGAVAIPSTLGGFEVVSIGEYAFSYNSSITSVTIPNGVTSVGGAAFVGCSGLTSVTIPNSVKTIGSPNNASSFAGCSSLTSIVIPDSVKSIGYSAFQSCTSLTSVTIGNGVTAIDSQTFYDCTSLTNVILGNGVRTIGAYAFSDCRTLPSVIVPDSVTRIDTGAFQYCTSLSSVAIGNGVTRISGSAFQYCTSLTTVTVGNGVRDISGYAFLNCSSLTSITIPGSVTTIGSSAFENCTALESVYFLGNMPSVGGALFGGIAPAGKVFYPRGNTTWGANYVGWLTQPYDLPPPPPPKPVGARVRVEHPAGATLVSGVSADPFPTSLIGVASSNRVYTLRNTGSTVLSNIVVAKSGPNSAEFSLTPPTSSSLAAGAVTTFSVGFLPASSGSRTAQISITSSDANNGPFLINLSGSAVSADADTDGDGLNDAAEVTMSALGFNWQNWQPDLVGALMSNANRANLFTQAQYNNFGALRFSNGQASVVTNPAGFKLVSRTNIPAVRMALPKNAAFTLNLGGTWTRYGLTGRDRAWTFNTNTGELRGTLGGTNERTLRLVPYNGSQAGPQMTIQLRPAP